MKKERAGWTGRRWSYQQMVVKEEAKTFRIKSFANDALCVCCHSEERAATEDLVVRDDPTPGRGLCGCLAVLLTHLALICSFSFQLHLVSIVLKTMHCLGLNDKKIPGRRHD